MDVLCVTPGNYPVLAGLECHPLCSEGRGSDVLLGLPYLLHLTRVSSDLQNTHPSLRHPQPLQGCCTGLQLPPCLPQAPPPPPQYPPEAHMGCVPDHHTISTPVGLMFKASQSLAPLSGTKHTATPGPED